MYSVLWAVFSATVKIKMLIQNFYFSLSIHVCKNPAEIKMSIKLLFFCSTGQEFIFIF